MTDDLPAENPVLETCVGLWTDRHFPPEMIAAQARAYGDSEYVDGVLIPDQLSGFVPRQLWTPENTPLAAVIGDPDSALDAFMVAPYLHAVAPELALHLTTDSIRRRPAELVQSMLTLAHLTGGRATFQVGAGEAKQTVPFGHPAKQGLSRLDDLLRIYRRVLETDGPFDFDGRRTQFRGAFLGGARSVLPTVWALGGGPKLTDTATSYADGMAIAVPNALATPERVGETVDAVRTQVEQKGRDPEAFRIGLWVTTLVHPDRAVVDAAFRNPVIKFVSAATGRIDPTEWEREGLGLPFPEGWSYPKDLLPYGLDDDLVRAVVDATTDEHIDRAWIAGQPREVAARIHPYLEAGIDWVMPIDYLGVVGDPTDAQASVAGLIELCAHLKAGVSSAAPAVAVQV